MQISSAACRVFEQGDLPVVTDSCRDQFLPPPDEPWRPSKPQLVDARDIPSMKQVSCSVPAYILLSLAHIEFTAVHCYWDTLVRFERDQLPDEYYRDFVAVVSDETRHFQMVSERLAQLGHVYGDIPAHKSLWEHAIATKNSLGARLAIVPMVQEARGLDAGPRFIDRLRSERDPISATIVSQIVDEEVRHVSAGVKWFKYICQRDQLDTVEEFHSLVRQYMPKGLFPPFNVEQRLKAGLSQDYYEPLVVQQ